MAQWNEIFVVDSLVEVDGNEIDHEKYKESWVKGKISSVPDEYHRRGKRFYTVKLEKDNKTVRMESNTIRPVQPVTTGLAFRQGKVVEFLKDNVWWKAKMMRTITPGSQYEIKVVYSGELETVSRNILRETKEWINTRQSWE